MSQRKQDTMNWTMKVPLEATATRRKSGRRKPRPASHPEIYRDLAMALIVSSMDVQRQTAP